MSTVTTQYEGPPARRISGTALAVRTLSGQTKLLVPVSAATATARKPNSHKQILVVPTPGGGARLATVANSSSNSPLLRHTHLHPHHTYSSSGSSGVRKDSPSYTYNRGGANDNYKSSGSRHNGNNDHFSAIDTSQLIRQQQLQQQQLREQYLKSKQEEEMIPEWKRKEDFFAALGLVTKQALKEIQNKKCERKRRTTANPQFSNAAIEAKRINAMEVAAKRAKRREMAASERNASAPLTRIARRNSQVPINPSQPSSLRSSLRPSTTNSSQPSQPSSSTTSFHQKAVFRQFPNSPSTNVTVAPDKSRNLVERLKSRYQLLSSPYQIHRNSNSSTTSHNNISNNLRSTNLPIAKPLLVKKVHNCYACCETCDPDLDAIMACVDCRCYFHATCVSSVDEINKTNSVPCPSCDKETSTTFDGFNSLPASDDLESNPERNTSKSEKPILEEEEEDVEDPEEEDEDHNLMEVEENRPLKSNPRPKMMTIEEIQQKFSKIGEGKNPIIVMTKAEFLKKQSRNQITFKTKETLLTRQNEIAKLINEGKKRYNELAVTLSDLKEDKIKLLQERSRIQDCLKKVTNVIKMVNKSDVEMDQAKVKDLNKPEESSIEVKNKPIETNGITLTSSEEQKTIESESSSSDDDSSDSEDSDEEDDQSNIEKKPEDHTKSPEPVDHMKVEAVNNVIEGQEDVIEQVDQTHESTISIIEEEVGEVSAEDKSNVPQVVEQAVVIVSKMKDTTSSLIVDSGTVKIEEGSSEVAQDVAEFSVGEDAIVIEEIDELGGNEVLITTTEEDEGNLVILGGESVATEKCNQFDDETSAAVASIQDQLDADGL